MTHLGSGAMTFLCRWSITNFFSHDHMTYSGCRNHVPIWSVDKFFEFSSQPYDSLGPWAHDVPIWSITNLFSCDLASHTTHLGSGGITFQCGALTIFSSCDWPVTLGTGGITFQDGALTKFLGCDLASHATHLCSGGMMFQYGAISKIFEL